MSHWLSQIAPDSVRRTPLGARGHNLLLTPLAAPRPLPLSADEQDMVRGWLKTRRDRARWSTLLAPADSPALAENLLRRLLEAGWCEVELHAETGLRFQPLHPFWVQWLDMYGLRHLLGMADARPQAEVVELWRGWQPRHPWLLGLAESLSPHLQSSTLERRLKLAQALDQWLLDGCWGTERQFSQRALGRSKAFGAADRQWLAEFGVDLEACGIAAHTPHVFLSGPLGLWAGQQCLLSAALLQQGVALGPEALMSVSAVEGAIRSVRIVENLSVFQTLSQQALPVLTVWVPGQPHQRWREAVRHLLSLLRVPVQIACDLAPSGIAVAMAAGQVAEQAGRPWSPWRMQAEQLTLANGAQPLSEAEQTQLARLMGGGLPPLLHGLAMEMQEKQCKVEQEALFIEDWGD
ncbi:DUF2399 domain-containing protein [Chromobacterium sp. IRSSSOUMB001]|uniref:DUF2399 domain-containing protein n=1 Tax=Chromobacterium sp. IRSSSOUMB001 TaxID=2927123 RepID=UPI0020C0A62C|nr:DUF2399 domain-containing protein [Chromobacterium sp. IRSSSOUMB001]